MTVMRSIRKATRASKIPYIVLAVLLSVGLVGSYAVWSLPNVPSNSAQQENASGSNVQANTDSTSAAQIIVKEADIRRYSQVLKASPQNLELWIQMGNDQYDLGNLYLQKGDSSQAVKEWKAAVESYGKALELDPANVDVRVDRATAAFYASDNQTAKQEFEEAVRKNPKHTTARSNYGVFLAQAMGDVPGAIQQWQAALDTNPDSSTVSRLKSLIAQYEGKK